MNTEVLIVGNGIAGTMLGKALLDKGISFVTVDQGFDAATEAAAGICNPIVFRRLNKSWKVDELLPIAEEKYLAFEQLLNASYLQKKRIVKLIRSEEEYNLWTQAINNTEATDYISLEEATAKETDTFKKLVHKGIVSPALQVNIGKLKSDFEAYLMQNKGFIKEVFTHNELKITPNEVKWGKVTAKHLVFCEGSGIKKNPYFNYLPLSPVKGEAIIVKIPGLNASDIYNNKIALCPMGDDRYWVGGTYQWENLDFLPSGTGQSELMDALNKTIALKYEVVDQVAGIRPAVKDRRPLVGSHPELKNMWLLNGMGTKGTMLAPYCADQLVSAMFESSVLNKEINCERFSSMLLAQ